MTQTMNAKTAMYINESEGDFTPKRKRKTKVNPKLCPELDNIGRHVYDNNTCKYCGIEGS